jgi:N-acetylmuramoyl-L-alanine amidase
MFQLIAIYLSKMFVCSGLLLGWYWITLRNKRFHHYNRFYLLLTVLLSTIVPLLHMQWFTFHTNNKTAITLFNVISSDGETESPITALALNPAGQLIQFLPFPISVVFLFLLSIRIFRIYKIKKSFPVSRTERFDLINTDLQQAPFSFFKNIFWRNDISLEERSGQQILEHEIVHIKQKHSLDKVFLQVAVSLFWMNPFYWVIQKELYMIHEFIADEKSVSDKDASSFAGMLLHAQYGNFMFAPAQAFFYSPIKRRLLMFTTSNEPRFTYLRRLMALPLLVFVTCLFAFKLQGNNESAIIKTNIPFKLVVDAGHGGSDAGAISASGKLEKDFNLAIAQKIKELSPTYGIDVVLTRDKDFFMSPQDKVNFSNAQNGNAFISIHVNLANPKEKGQKSGMEVCVSEDNAKYIDSKIFGSAVIQSLDNNFKVNTSLLQKKPNIWVLKANALPAILLECGYLDNSTDISLLTNSSEIEKLAGKILEGVALYANNRIDSSQINHVQFEEAQ